ncbi:MAG: UDP-2,4-diacetamido-2,4,6-trideoxy-beta-L-altropyranose hydrolase [Verrucomicrobiota bacterium]|nr:UDP-2,4-diacetamido-2,4,6-trideoxy-beta-L-altropyranose hydrolase [Verrucomicrobiota bacterium]
MPNEKITGFIIAATHQIGLGHARRCLTIASELKKRGEKVIFFGDIESGAADLIGKSGAELVSVPLKPVEELVRCIREQGVSKVMIDTYELNSTDIKVIGEAFTTGVVDDLADRELAVDFVTNGLGYAESLTYRVRPDTQKLLGTQYTILREEFHNAPDRTAREEIRDVLISMGGSDPLALSGLTSLVVAGVFPEAKITVVLGPLAKELKGDFPNSICVIRDTETMAELMRKSDIAIVGGGQTLYELAIVGTPAISVLIAENQRHNWEYLRNKNVIIGLHPGDDTADARETPDKFPAALMTVSTSYTVQLMKALDGISLATERQRMINAGKKLVDGMGAHRVAEAWNQL